MSAPQTERNAAIVAGYLAGNSRRQLAEVFGCSPSNVHRIVTAAGVSLGSEERGRRHADRNRRITARPEYRERKSRWARKWWSERR